MHLLKKVALGIGNWTLGTDMEDVVWLFAQATRGIVVCSFIEMGVYLTMSFLC